MSSKLKKNLTENIRAARNAGVPLVAVTSYDPESTMQAIQKTLNGEDESTPVVQWDVIRGWRGRNEAAKAAIAAALGDESLEVTCNPVACLELASNLPEKTILFVMNAQHYICGSDPNNNFIQALWNLRDVFKADERTIVLLAPSYIMPSELQQDIVVFEEQLPTDEDLAEIAKEIAEAAEVVVDQNQIDKCVIALRGIAAFPAEQALAMSITKDGFDFEMLWDRKRQMINDTPGLSVYFDGQKFDDLGGLTEIKSRFRRILKGKKPPTVVVWIDEIEKQMSGADTSHGDTSGTSQDQLGVLLSEMQDKEYSGALLVGVPGAAKSAFAKSVANEAGILTIKLDLGGTKDSLVGKSEERIRHAMKIIEAVGGFGGALFLATSNDIRCVKTELKRRFRKGIWYFDLPDQSERDVIIKMYVDKFKLDKKQKMPTFEGFTGAEIETTCATAWEEGISLEEAATYIIPVSVSGKEDISRLRSEADGRYNSVVHSGPYVFTAQSEVTQPAAQKRKLTTSGN